MKEKIKDFLILSIDFSISLILFIAFLYVYPYSSFHNNVDDTICDGYLAIHDIKQTISNTDNYKLYGNNSCISSYNVKWNSDNSLLMIFVYQRIDKKYDVSNVTVSLYCGYKIRNWNSVILDDFNDSCYFKTS